MLAMWILVDFDLKLVKRELNLERDVASLVSVIRF